MCGSKGCAVRTLAVAERPDRFVHIHELAHSDDFVVNSDETRFKHVPP
jgi:hypothetical protein